MKGFIVIISLLVGTVVPLPYQLQHNHITRRLLNDVAVGKNQPPKAMKVEHKMEMFGDVRIDEYFWLQDDNGTNPQVLSYINDENNYTNLIMSDTKYLQDQIYAEMRGQLKDEDMTAPRRRGPYYYYERTSLGSDHFKYCRRLAPNGAEQPSVHDVMLTGPNSPPENVLLDTNLKAKGHKYYYIGAFEVSPNHSLLAYTENTEGDQNYTANFIDAESKHPVAKSLIGLSYNLLWAGNETLLYITMDDTKRQDKVWLHKLGEEQSNDLCLYHEKDSNFSVDINESEDKKFLFVGSRSETTSFTFYFDISNPDQGLLPLTPRIDGIFTSASHRGAQFIITRWSGEISELSACPVYNVSAVTVILPHRESVKIQDIQLFSGHLVVFERENGLIKIIIFNLLPLEEPIQMLQTAQAIEYIDPVYAVYRRDSEFYSGILRFSYSALKTPDTVFDYDLNTGASVAKKTDTVLGGFDSSNYIMERKWATAPDGAQVPMSVVYRKDLFKSGGSNPLILYAYGAYEVSIDPTFSGSILPMLDRGFVYVIAHVRGGGEVGSQWHTNGMLLKKKNTFTDFIACAEYLIEMKYCTKEKLAIQGDYSGGLLIAAVLNMRPELFKVATVQSPFVDVVTRMLDRTNPQVTAQQEYGDPREEEFYFYMKSYSPLDNVSAQQYPSTLVTSYYPGSGGSQSAKFVAKLRDVKTDKNLLLLQCDVSDGKSAEYWRFEFLKAEAFKYTFILNMVS